VILSVDSNLTLRHRLVERFPGAKGTTLKRMVSDGRVSINDRSARRLKEPISSKDQIIIHPPPEVRPANPARILSPLKLVHEDEDLLVINKPAGLLTSTVRNEKRPTAVAILRRYVAETSPKHPLGVVHRLDRDAGGLLVFSKSHLAYESLKSQFFKHTVQREYEAWVRGVPSPASGRIESRLIERADGSVRSTSEHARGQRAITDYEVLQKKGGNALVRVRLLTGRKHQIRVHLSERGHPIIGDRVYGIAAPGSKQPQSPELQLRAVLLAFTHPRTGKQVSFELPSLADRSPI
jgi:RluA family pseudouridine synthase